MHQNQRTNNGHGGHHRPDILTRTHQQVTAEVLNRTFKTSPTFWMIALVLALLVVLGVVGFIMRLGDGFAERLPWGYLAAGMGFLLTTAMAAPVVSILPRLVKGHWGRPISRAAEMWSVVGILCTLLMIPLLFVLPSAEGRKTIWFMSQVHQNWPPLAPWGWQIISMAGFAMLGLALLWVGAIPDLATARDRAPAGARKGWYDRLSIGWEGTNAQWRRLRAWLGLLGGLYLIAYVGLQFMVSSDFVQSFVPGWKDSVFPGWQAVNGFQSGLAVMLLTAYVLRRWGGFKDYIFLEQFWAMGRLLLPLSILFFYFWASGFITYWYGRMPAEHGVLLLTQFGPYLGIFVPIMFLNFILPLGLLIWNRIRKSILGPTLISLLVITGTFLDKIRLYVGAFSVPNEQLKNEMLEVIPATHYPDIADVFMLVGVLAGAILLYMLASRLFPILNIWEQKEGLVLQTVRPFLKTELKVVAKPD
ncbi:MAG: hypothetical protein EXR67_03800 [Dehalococcoidia bacterium]|nr:hypothetical protein [Dehalococcoidia bacterium]